MKQLHPQQAFHARRFALFALVGVAVLISHGATHATPLTTYQPQVLTYATGMNIGDLYATTNSARAANGLAPLALNAQLNNSAQAKAQHMIANNYWSHVAPDGTQPWYFFQSSGYNYVGAGENLAYGFMNGSDVTTAWMNSAGHRANIVGAYSDVGFGIASGTSYQGGENTVVVAHYGLQRTPTPAPTPTPTPTPPQPTTPTPPVQTPTPAPTPPKNPTAAQEQPTPNASTSTSGGQATSPTDMPTPTAPDQTTPPAQQQKPVAVANTENTSSKDITALSQMQAGKVPVAVVGSLSVLMLATGGFALTHRKFMRHLIAEGKNYITHHPFVDLTVIGLALVAILATIVGKLL